jgi:hypothetical protein
MPGVPVATPTAWALATVDTARLGIEAFSLLTAARLVNPENR